MDDGKVKLVPPTEIAKDDNIETIYQAPASQLRVVISKEKSTLMRISALGSHEQDSEKKENHIEESEVERGMEVKNLD